MLNFKFFKSLVLAALIAVILMLFGCRNENVDLITKNTPTPKSPLVVGVFEYPTSYLPLLSKELGYFEEQGIDVEIKFFNSYSEAFDKFRNEESDFMGIAFMDIFKEIDEGKNYKAVVVTDYSYGADAIIGNDSIKKIEDLKNKTIGVEKGTISEFYLAFVLKKYGFSLNDVNVVDMTASETVQALSDNIVDAIVTYQPFVYDALNTTKSSIIKDSSEERGLIPDVWIIDENRYKEREEDYKKFFVAWFKTIDYLKNNKEQAAEIIAGKTGMTKEDYLAQLESLYFLNYRDNLTSYSREAGVESLYSSGRLIVNYLVENSIINDTPELNNIISSEIVKNIQYDK